MPEFKDLLIEIGTEELPLKALQQLSSALGDGIADRLRQANVEFNTIELFATPRRLGVCVTHLATAQPDQHRVRRGPALSAAFDTTGKPSKAALGFAASCGLALESLSQEVTPKGTFLIARQAIPGQATAALIPNILQSALDALPIPKRMRWGDSTAEFVRPVQWVILLFGDEVLPATILGVPSSRTTRGHRFHHPAPLTIDTPAQYANVLRDQGKVEPVFATRREQIRTLVEQTTATANVVVRIDAQLLDEVTALCEWPVPIIGTFDAEFLRVPAEALIETMQGHQKYFPVFDQTGALAPRFITISNIDSLDPAQVQAGNERVIRPRFKDAAFFWDQDRKQPLEQRLDGLRNLVFQHKLGSMLDKAQRLALTSAWLAVRMGLDAKVCQRSALLCKCDLLTQLVGEFASLQGIMGRYLAAATGEDPNISAAIGEQYRPRYAGDALPHNPYGQALALADKFDNLLGIFAIGSQPTGLKDPYSLRRAAVGALRILIETPLPLDIRELATQAALTLENKVDATQVIDAVVAYLLERLPSYFGDQGVSSDIVDAVLATGGTVPSDIACRIRALVVFRSLPEAASLAAAHKRIRNILRQAADAIPAQVQPELLTATQELLLYQHIEAIRPEVQRLFDSSDYTAALLRLASLRDVVDDFFIAVMVMTEDPQIRVNRLALLASLVELFGRVADFSLLQ